MVKNYDPIGRPIKFGFWDPVAAKFRGIIIQLCVMDRRIVREPPAGEPKYPFKLGYIIKECDEFTHIEDFYKFIKWQLEFEKKVRFLGYTGKMVDIKPNSLWKEKHLEPLQRILKLPKEEPIVDEDDWLPEYWPFDNREQYLKWLRE
jgi:hypothetical protein